MQKLVFISNIPAPYQVKFCKALQKYYEAEFWFYDSVEAQRASWWKTDLGDACKILPGVRFKSSTRYYARHLTKYLDTFHPDYVLLGGFSIPSNYIAYKWAKKNGKKAIVLTEISRTQQGEVRGRNVTWRMLKNLYYNIDAVFALNEEAYLQFKDTFAFSNKVKQLQYAADLDAYLKHENRTAKEAYTILFANQLIALYNPLTIIEAFKIVAAHFPDTRLQLNAKGTLREECASLIAQYQLQDNCTFLDTIRSWDTLHEVYRQADILVLPAYFSNGNFTIYEAMASGMGIVVSNQVRGNGKLIQNTQNGFITEPDDSKAIAEAIMNYIKQPGLFAKHAAVNRELVKPYTMEATAALYYRQLSAL